MLPRHRAPELSTLLNPLALTPGCPSLKAGFGKLLIRDGHHAVPKRPGKFLMVFIMPYTLVPVDYQPDFFRVLGAGGKAQ